MKGLVVKEPNPSAASSGMPENAAAQPAAILAFSRLSILRLISVKN
jgi:hypothetical protein